MKCDGDGSPPMENPQDMGGGHGLLGRWVSCVWWERHICNPTHLRRGGAAAANADGLDNQDMMLVMHCFMVKAKCHITVNLACVKIVSMTVGVNTRI